MTALIYQLENVEKRYGESFALAVERLDVPAGETLCLLGPTGSGKSTLLRLLSGLEPPTRGEIVFEGRPLDATALPLAIQRRITMVHQRPLLLNRTVRANVEYPLRLRRWVNHSQAVAQVLERLRLTRLSLQSARTLSGGQTQLVALARALVIRPDVLLLDEPTANLDPAHVELIEEVVSDARRQHGLTVVWATHNLFQTRRVADRAALLLDGRIVEVAPRQEFFESPADRRTADFVQGKMVY